MNGRSAVHDTGSAEPIVDAYRQHRMGLTRFATVLVGPDAAHDVVSSALLSILESPPPDLEQPKAYLYRAVANRSRNHARGEARRRRRQQQVAGPRSTSTIPEPYPEVREAVEQLSVRQRAVVYLSYWEDLTAEAIAAHLGIGVGSVHRHLARAKRHLRRALYAHDR